MPERIELFTVDLSYLSLTSAIPQFESLEIAAEALLVALVKPMFELHLDTPPEDEQRLARALETAVNGIAATKRWRPTGTMRSPLRGARGAVEFFVYAQRLAE